MYAFVAIIIIFGVFCVYIIQNYRHFHNVFELIHFLFCRSNIVQLVFMPSTTSQNIGFHHTSLMLHLEEVEDELMVYTIFGSYILILRILA